MKLTKRAMMIPAASLLLLGGCALTTPPKNEYAAFAEAGAGYANAVDKLLVAAGEAQVDSTSWSLVADKSDLGQVDNATYNKKTKDDLERLAAIKRLRMHAELLGKYFGHLHSLATSDAPETTKSKIQNVVRGMTELSSTSRSLLPALPEIGRVAVDANIRIALKEELEKRKEVIRKELQFQEVLLEELKGQICSALKRERNTKEQNIVLAPISAASPLANPEEWVAKRHKVIYMPETVEEIQSASEISGKMRDAFEDILSGKDATGRINALINDIESVLAIAEAINS
jgi:hypothetical protein